MYTTTSSTSISQARSKVSHLGPVEATIKRDLFHHKTLCFALLDSEGLKSSDVAIQAGTLQDVGVSALLLGGSTAVDQQQLAKIANIIKKTTTIPLILFPG